jgi:putative MATE family efflux protein
LANASIALPGSSDDLNPRTLNRTIVKLAVPAVLENLLGTAVLLVDTLLIGRLHDPAALAAIGVSGSYLWIAQGVFMALGIGALAIVARAWGESNPNEAKRAAGQSISLCVVLSVVLMALMMFFAEPFMRLLVQDPDPAMADHVVQLGTLYTHLMLTTALLAWPRMVMSNLMRAAGDTRTPMLITLAVNVLNMGLAALLIFGAGPVPAMGLAGAGIATAISLGLGGVVSFVAMWRGWTPLHVSPREMAVWHWPDVQRIWRVALPNIIESGIQRVGFITFVGIVSSLGTATMAAHQITNSIESFAFMPAWGLAIATSTLVGQSLGARRIDIAELATKRSAIFGVGAMMVMGVLFVIFAPQMAAAFGAQDDVLALATVAVALSALELPSLAFYMIYSGALRGAGDTRSPMIVSLIGSIFLRVSMVWLLAVGLGMGLAGVWLGTAIDWLGRALLVYLLYRRGRWKQLRV